MATAGAAARVRKLAVLRQNKPAPKIYLCDWFVKLVKPGRELPKDHVQCHVPMKMTKFDIKNYFERIYGVDIHKVNTRIQRGKEKNRVGKSIPISLRKYRTPDVKVAYLILAKGEFKFPDLFSKYISNPNQP
ncbi:PREDICTED: 39S ribosomal protein L23, mitochondrial-like [Amphimedon queenslandica]|uniref:Large ribosomal subunit protein uL23m n=1 Tax=Amphimedon queenslandica TaxID=400682 RepID=A0A1X7VNX4_AMPQE|nr:PREDICTED: 39S ribosomal protein L23, mitochondrial-like [Amphimedon queenslandica]|eukprot:XP_019860599.1 PREDICTED: 39S ribosomal protein L23, mitochondrial-like [Amphimedon queenslandica]